MTGIRTAVVGVGHLGASHARIYGELPQASLVGVYDIDRNRNLEVAGSLGVRAFSSIEEVTVEAEAVSLAVPTDMHYSLGKYLLSAGMHVLVEKPITERLEQAAELVDLAGKHSLVLQVGHVERFNSALLAASEHISKALFVESERLAPFNPRGTEVPVVLDLMIHDIDIILSIMRRPVKEVSALGIPVFTPSVDIANARLGFEGGAVASVSASRVSMGRVRKMRFFSPESYVSVDMLKLSAVACSKRPEAQFSMGASAADTGQGKDKIPDMLNLVVREELDVDMSREPLMLEIEDFLVCIKEGKQPVVSGRDGLQALEVAGRIMKAIDSSLAAAGMKQQGKELSP